MFKKVLYAGTALLLSTTFSFAEDAFTTDEVVVTAGRVPVDAQSLARSYTVVTGEEIERRQVKSVGDALRHVPGLHVSKSGGAGGLTEIRIRGAEANHVLVFIDGVEISDSSTNFDFSEITIDQIERIEVLRGPQSALYGAGATAGVINIITKSGIEDGEQVTVKVEGSTELSQAYSALFQAGNTNGNIAVGVSYRDEKGFDISNDPGGDDDGYKNFTFNTKGTLYATQDITLKYTARYTDRENKNDNTAFGCGNSACYVVDGNGETNGIDIYGSLAADIALFEGAAIFTPRVSYAEDENDNINVGFPSFNESSTLKIDPQIALKISPNHTLVLASEYKRETYLNTFAGGDTKDRENYGGAVDYQAQLTEDWFVQAGVRYDHNTRFDDAFAYAASTSYRVMPGTTLRASIGQGQTNPEFTQLFGFVPGTFVGNPNLSPEKNFSWDIGITQELLEGRAKLSATYFNARLKDEITGSGLTVANASGISKKQGVETALTISPIQDLIFNASYTYLDAIDGNGLRETRRPEHSGGLNMTYTFMDGRATFGADLTLFGNNDQRDFGDPSFTSPIVRHDGYITLDLNGSYKVDENTTLFATVINLLDESYEEVRGFRSQPLTGYVGVKTVW